MLVLELVVDVQRHLRLVDDLVRVVDLHLDVGVFVERHGCHIVRVLLVRLDVNILPPVLLFFFPRNPNIYVEELHVENTLGNVLFFAVLSRGDAAVKLL